ncbi:MAG: EAL domain-containing protein [Alphaproteobacteria bacterium]
MIGILLFLFFVTSTVAHLLTKRIDSEVTQLVRAAELVLEEGSGETEAAELARSLADWGATGTIDLAVWFLLSMTLFGVVVGISAAIALSRGLIRPILELAAGAEAIGEGKLDHRIAIDSEDEIGALAESFNLMAKKRQQIEAALRDQAHHDALTKLPNRTYFQIRLAEALDNARRAGRMVAVHCLDLDHFKDVNDTLGHPAGDDLLKQVSARLLACVRKTDTVARLGGDEFAIIQSNLNHQDGIAVLAERMVESIAAPFQLDQEQVFTGASIGITVFPHDDTDPDSLFKNADLALYQAKQEGRSNYRLFDPAMNEEIHARKALEQDIRQALDNGEFFLNYQPRIEIASGRIIGVEALVRWRHPERGMVSPAEFIPVAEQARLISRLTDGVLREACEQAKAWQDAGLPPIRVSVNLSPADFKRTDIVSTVTGILDESGLTPQYLELEITEGMVMSGVESVIATLNELHALGVELAIADFGTGFSSMNYLKQFPLDRLKIDQSFVRHILTSEQDASITKAIIQLGHSLGFKVIAEGVETERQLEFLRVWGCDEAQGYYFSRPIPPEKMAAMLEAQTDEPQE